MEHNKAFSTIAIRTSKNVQFVKCMYDGTPNVMGKRLLEHYSKTYFLPLQIMRKGYLVFLGDNLKKYSDEEPNGTLDLTGVNKERKPKSELASLAELVSQETESEYIYLWDKDRWFVLKVVDKKPYLGSFMELSKLV